MMKAVLAVVAGVVLLGGVAHATVPDPAYCSVDPCDTYGIVLTAPYCEGTQTPSTQMDIIVNVRNAMNDPIPNAFVEFVPGNLGNHTVCATAVLTGTTDGDGNVTFNLAVGGCSIEANSMRIIANTVEIRAFDATLSPDYDGAVPNGLVDLADLIYFAGQYGNTGGCADYFGDGVALDDLIVFASAYGGSCCE